MNRWVNAFIIVSRLRRFISNVDYRDNVEGVSCISRPIFKYTSWSDTS